MSSGDNKSFRMSKGDGDFPLRRVTGESPLSLISVVTEMSEISRHARREQRDATGVGTACSVLNDCGARRSDLISSSSPVSVLRFQPEFVRITNPRVINKLGD